MDCSSHPSALFLLYSFFRNYYTLILEDEQLVDFFFYILVFVDTRLLLSCMFFV